MTDMAVPSDHRASAGWELDEMASAGRENLDADHVSRYDAKEDAAAAAEVALLEGLGLDRQSHVVDIGAGTGQFTLAVASVCARGGRGRRLARDAAAAPRQSGRVVVAQCRSRAVGLSLL